jgi:transcriptional regulator with XRE-family HTH domain
MLKIQLFIMDNKEDSLLKLGRRLTELRQKQDLSIDELATRAGIGAAEIGGIEAGKVDPPLTSILALCRALGLSPGQLLNI